MNTTLTPARLAGSWFARRTIAFVVSAWFCTLALAQAPAAPAKSVPLADSVVELSPFMVTTDKDTGYAAGETLAGTRMRTSLRDVGASLTILTPEFMRDLAVNSFDQALLYTPSVDAVEGDNTDVSRQSGTQMRYGTGQSYSIRGFVSNAGNQSISHDFFSALEPTDNYNLERLTLSLGPNSMLIGVGNPQGTAITTTKRAQLRNQKTSVQFQTDRWGSRRMAIDHNQPLIKDRLAVRLNLLHDEQREFRRYEGRDQERMTLSVTAKPFPNTVLTVNHESYSLHSNASSLMWGFNGSALRWLAAGKPTVEFLPAGQSWTAARAYVDAKGNRIPVAAGVVDADGLVDAQSDFDPKGALGANTANNPTWVVGLNLTNPVINMRYQGQLQNATFGGINSSNYQSSDPWALMGMNKDTNLNGGTWDDPSSLQHGRWSQAMVEQKLTEGLYLELGANLALYNQNLDPNNFTVITIDPNRYLPDGSLNPGYLMPYDSNGQMQFRKIRNRSTEFRGTLSYERDLTKINRWFGKHNFAALAQASRSEAAQDLMRVFNLATIGYPTSGGWSGDATNSTNLLSTRVYFVNGNVPTMPDSSQVQRNFGLLNGYVRMAGSTANEAAPINLSLQSFSNAVKNKSTNDSLSLGWQARWLRDRLVTVVGYRTDDTKSYGVPVSRTAANPAVAGSDTDPLKKFFTPAAQIPFNDKPTVAAKGITRTAGAVLHVLPWLSLTYNQSSNFLPVSDASWLNALGEPAPNSAGETKDYGVRLSWWQGKVSLGVNRFKTSADNQARNANGYVGGTRNILTRLRNNYKTPGDSHFKDLAEVNFYPVDTGNVADTWSYVAEGYELNLIFNPSSQWRMALSGSSNINKQGTHLAAVGRYLYTDSKFQGLGTARNFASELNKVAAGQTSAFFDLNPADSVARTQAAADALYIQQQADAQEKTYLDDIALTGITTARNGKYAVNGLITRSFNDGRLKGWSVGTNFRWRSVNTLGYQRRADATGAPTGIYDVTRPLKGKEYWDLGAMVSYQRRVFKNVGLRVQLNIQNLPNWQAPRLVKSDVDSMGVYGSTTTIVPVLWELRRPRNFVLTTTFDF
jgi:hypothetical protein